MIRRDSRRSAKILGGPQRFPMTGKVLPTIRGFSRPFAEIPDDRESFPDDLPRFPILRRNFRRSAGIPDDWNLFPMTGNLAESSGNRLKGSAAGRLGPLTLPASHTPP